MNFHGFGGLNVPADEYLNAMMNRFAVFFFNVPVFFGCTRR